MTSTSGETDLILRCECLVRGLLRAIDQLIGQLISRPLSWSVGWSVLVSWSVGWSSLLAGWAVGWWAGDWSIVSNARVEGGTNRYDLFDLAGNQRCGRCAKANSKDYEKEQTIEG